MAVCLTKGVGWTKTTRVKVPNGGMERRRRDRVTQITAPWRCWRRRRRRPSSSSSRHLNCWNGSRKREWGGGMFMRLWDCNNGAVFQLYSRIATCKKGSGVRQRGLPPTIRQLEDPMPMEPCCDLLDTKKRSSLSYHLGSLLLTCRRPLVDFPKGIHFVVGQLRRKWKFK